MRVPGRWVLAGAQGTAVALALLGLAGVVPSMLFSVVLPLSFTVLFATGAFLTVRDGRGADRTLWEDGARAVGTAVCGVLMVLNVAATIYFHFFFTFPADWGQPCPRARLDTWVRETGTQHGVPRQRDRAH